MAMKHVRWLTVLTLTVVLVNHAWAQDRCIGPKDNTVAVNSYGVPPIDAADIIWCDDFNTYCWGNEALQSTWPGYPPTPDNICGPEEGPSTPWFHNAVHWPRMITTGNRAEVHVDVEWVGWDVTTNWKSEPYVGIQPGHNTTTVYNSFNMSGAIENRFGEGSDLLFATDENPLVLRYWMYSHYQHGMRPAYSPHYVEIRMDRGTDHPNDRAVTDYVEQDCMTWRFCSCINDNQDVYCEAGTCDGPSCHQWFCDDFGEGDRCQGGPNNQQSCTTNADCGKTCGTEQIQGSWVLCEEDAECRSCVGGPSANEACVEDEECGGCVGGAKSGDPCASDATCQRPCVSGQQAVCESGPHEGMECSSGDECRGGPVFPIVNQQRLNTAITVPHPPLDNEQTWRSLAFGMLAHTDTNPCSPPYGKPVDYRPSTFDGNRWHELRKNVFPAHEYGSNFDGSFHFNRGQAFFEMQIQANQYILRLLTLPSSGATQPVWSDAVVPRRYFGPFNTISMGTGPSRKWVQDTETGAWSLEGEPDVWRYVKDYPETHWFHTWIDRPAVLGGEVGLSGGACCLEDLTCIETDWEDCELQGGTFRGFGTLCAEITCCHYPWADADGDGDVDQVDFGIWQSCYTGPGGGILPGCECFDRNNSGSVDGNDFNEFMNCYTGANVAFNPLCSPYATPDTSSGKTLALIEREEMSSLRRRPP
jgi:hypothetical protein